VLCNPALTNYSIKWQADQRWLGELKFKCTSDSIQWLWNNLGFCTLSPYIRWDRRQEFGGICTAPTPSPVPVPSPEPGQIQSQVRSRSRSETGVRAGESEEKIHYALISM
jgi:hypothetical protein